MGNTYRGLQHRYQAPTDAFPIIYKLELGKSKANYWYDQLKGKEQARTQATEHQADLELRRRG